MRMSRLVPLLLSLPVAAATLDTPILPVAEIQPGMKGYALSTFHGSEPTRFDVEVIDVLPKADIDGAWIMIRMVSGPVAERNTGVVKGMSGSPVYIDDKLVGAVAYGYATPTENVCFLTPIENMLRVLDEAEQPALARGAAPRTVALRRPVSVDGERRVAVEVHERPVPTGYRARAGTLVAERLMTPVTISGLGAVGLELLSRDLEPYGLTAMAGPGGGQRPGSPTLVPGSPIGVAFVSGDVTAVATGTVTAVAGDRIIAFGHPLMQRNRVALPLVACHVVDVWNSWQASSRITAAMDTVGTLVQDGHWGIVGRLDVTPNQVPMTLRIHDRDRDETKVFSCQVADDDQLAPTFAMSIANGVVADWLGSLPKATVATRTRITFAGREPLDREEVAAIEGSAVNAALADFSGAVNLALSSPYGRLPLEGIELTVEVARGDEGAVIERAYVDQTTVAPGESIQVELDIRRRRDDSVFRQTVAIPVPADAPSGKTRLAICGGVGEPGLAGQLKLLVPPPRDQAQLIGQFQAQDTRNRTLVAKLALPTTDLAIRGERLPNPPAQLAGLLSQAGTTDIATGQAEIRVELPLDCIVLNGASSPITVQRPGEGEGEAPKQSAEILRGLPVTIAADLPEPLFAPPAWLAEATPLIAFDLADLPGAIRRNAPPSTQAATAGPQPGSGAAQPGGPPATGDQPKPPPAVTSREPRLFVQNTPADFSGAELRGTAVHPDGGVVLSVWGEPLTTVPEPAVFASATGPDGSLYLATGNNGDLYRWRDGGLESVYRGPAPLVTAVAVDGDTVYFATAPDGVIRRLTADGAEVVAATGAHYVWKLLPGPDGLLVATGEPAGVMRLGAEGLQSLHEGGSGHFLCLARDAEGTVYAGGSPQGRIVRLKDGRAETVARGADEVYALTVGPDGTLYYGHGSQIGSLEPSGRLRLTPSLGGVAIGGLDLTEQGLLATSKPAAAPARASLWLINPAEGNGRRLMEFDALAAPELRRAGNEVIVTCGAPAHVYRLTLPRAPEGTYDSKVFDAQMTSAWGAIELGVRMPDGATVAVLTRTGNSPQPGDDWTGWLPATAQVNSPPARYLQYRLQLTSSANGAPVVDYLRVHYNPLNVAPSVLLEAPVLGTAWRGRQEVAWKIADGNGDQPMVTVLIRRVGTDAWQPIAVEVPAGQGKVPIETDKLDDGTYELRVIADDGMFNASDPRVAERTSDPFIIDNHAPELQLPPSERFAMVDGRLELTFTARDVHRLGGAEWRLGTGPWRPAAATDGLFDTANESIRLRTHRLPPGDHVVEIRVRDTAGNEGTAKINLKLQAPPAA